MLRTFKADGEAAIPRKHSASQMIRSAGKCVCILFRQWLFCVPRLRNPRSGGSRIDNSIYNQAGTMRCQGGSVALPRVCETLSPVGTDIVAGNVTSWGASLGWYGEEEEDEK